VLRVREVLGIEIVSSGVELEGTTAATWRWLASRVVAAV
jgi:hypothetical protein